MVTDKLFALHENTDIATEAMIELIGEVADTSQFDMRMSGVEWRYNIGNRALALARVAELRLSEYAVEEAADVNFDLVFAPILRPRPRGI